MFSVIMFQCWYEVEGCLQRGLLPAQARVSASGGRQPPTPPDHPYPAGHTCQVMMMMMMMMMTAPPGHPHPGHAC